MNKVTLELDLDMALTSDGLLLATASNVVGVAIKGHLLTVIDNLTRDDLSEESKAIRLGAICPTTDGLTSCLHAWKIP